MSTTLLERMQKLVSWSFSLSTIEQNTAVLAELITEIEKLRSPVSSGAVTTEDKLVKVIDNLNSHVVYMVMRPDIRAAPAEFRVALMQAWNLDILTDNTCIVASKQLPEIAPSLIPDDIDLLKKGTPISVECAIMYPEFMIGNVKLMKTTSLLVALQTLLRGTGDGRNHEVPSIIENNARHLLDELWSRCDMNHEIVYEKWISCVSMLVSILAEDKDIQRSYTDRLVEELKPRISKHPNSSSILVALNKNNDFKDRVKALKNKDNLFQ
jgi:hypothetical protein